MNKENLLKMADFIQGIPQKEFSMYNFRSRYDNSDKSCNSIGCIIGHCTILDTDENIDKSRRLSGFIDFYKWSESFTGISTESEEWNYLFAWEWYESDNTPIGAAKRIRYFVENGLPENWYRQMCGIAKLSYI